MNRLALASVAAVIAAGTAAPAALADPAGDLAHARELWAARAATDYRYTIKLTCFCTLTGATPRTLRVVNGKPRSTPVMLRGYDTVEELFAIVEKAQTGGAQNVQVRYAPNTGIPIFVGIDWNLLAIDDESTITVGKIHAPRGD